VEQIRNLVDGCNICQERRNNNLAQQYHPTEVPEHPFQKVATDFFQLAGKHYLLAVDYYSKWPCVVEMSSTTSDATIREQERVFTDFGVPETLVLDNGPQFGSAVFQAFSRQQPFSHVTSSPFYPESNGVAERSLSEPFALLPSVDAFHLRPFCYNPVICGEACHLSLQPSSIRMSATEKWKTF
jgi:hypothetical protein